MSAELVLVSVTMRLVPDVSNVTLAAKPRPVFEPVKVIGVASAVPADKDPASNIAAIPNAHFLILIVMARSLSPTERFLVTESNKRANAAKGKFSK